MPVRLGDIEAAPDKLAANGISDDKPAVTLAEPVIVDAKLDTAAALAVSVPAPVNTAAPGVNTARPAVNDASPVKLADDNLAEIPVAVKDDSPKIRKPVAKPPDFNGAKYASPKL
jgi:poly-gamma-glutamate capsule biosynthesis protein CapA/YwtB (metallophosphatase superfamily)